MTSPHADDLERLESDGSDVDQTVVSDGVRIRDLILPRMRVIMCDSLPLYRQTPATDRKKVMEPTWREVWEVQKPEWNWGGDKLAKRANEWQKHQANYQLTKRAFHLWFKHYGAMRARDDSHGVRIRTWTARDVFNRLYPEEVERIIVDSSEPSIQRGTPKYLGLYQRAITAGVDALSAPERKELDRLANEWTSSGPPWEVKKAEAEKHLDGFMKKTIEEAALRMGVCVLMIAVTSHQERPHWVMMEGSGRHGFTTEEFENSEEHQGQLIRFASMFHKHVQKGLQNDNGDALEPNIRKERTAPRKTQENPPYEFELKDGEIVFPKEKGFYRSLFQGSSVYVRDEMRKYVRTALTVAHSAITHSKHTPIAYEHFFQSAEDSMQLLEPECLPMIDGARMHIGDPGKLSAGKCEELCDHWCEFPPKFHHWSPRRCGGKRREPVPLEERWWNCTEDLEEHRPAKRRSRAKKASSGQTPNEESDSREEPLASEALSEEEDVPTLETKHADLIFTVHPGDLSEQQANENWPGTAPEEVPNTPRARMLYLKQLAGQNSSLGKAIDVAYATMDVPGNLSDEHEPPKLPISWTSDRVWFPEYAYKDEQEMSWIYRLLLQRPWAGPARAWESRDDWKTLSGLSEFPVREQWLLNTAIILKDSEAQVDPKAVTSSGLWSTLIINIDATQVELQLENEWDAFSTRLKEKSIRRSDRLPPLLISPSERCAYLRSLSDQAELHMLIETLADVRLPRNVDSEVDPTNENLNEQKWSDWDASRLGVNDVFHASKAGYEDISKWLTSKPWLDKDGRVRARSLIEVTILRTCLIFCDIDCVLNGRMEDSSWNIGRSAVRDAVISTWVDMKQALDHVPKMRSKPVAKPAKKASSGKAKVPDDLQLDNPGARNKDTALRKSDRPVDVRMRSGSRMMGREVLEIAQNNRAMEENAVTSGASQYTDRQGLRTEKRNTSSRATSTDEMLADVDEMLQAPLRFSEACSDSSEIQPGAAVVSDENNSDDDGDSFIGRYDSRRMTKAKRLFKRTKEHISDKRNTNSSVEFSDSDSDLLPKPPAHKRPTQATARRKPRFVTPKLSSSESSEDDKSEGSDNEDGQTSERTLDKEVLKGNARKGNPAHVMKYGPPNRKAKANKDAVEELHVTPPSTPPPTRRVSVRTPVPSRRLLESEMTPTGRPHKSSNDRTPKPAVVEQELTEVQQRRSVRTPKRNKKYRGGADSSDQDDVHADSAATLRGGPAGEHVQNEVLTARHVKKNAAVRGNTEKQARKKGSKKISIPE